MASRTKKARDIERVYSRAQLVAKLRRLASSIETGRAFTIQVGGERLRIPADATFYSYRSACIGSTRDARRAGT